MTKNLALRDPIVCFFHSLLSVSMASHFPCELNVIVEYECECDLITFSFLLMKYNKIFENLRLPISFIEMRDILMST